MFNKLVNEPGLVRSRARLMGTLTLVAGLVSACGGGGGGSDQADRLTEAPRARSTEAAAAAPSSSVSGGEALLAVAPVLTQRQAVRLAEQTTFGQYEWLVGYMRTKTPSQWLYEQFNSGGSRYVSGGGAELHQFTGPGQFCDTRGTHCWRDWSSNQPLLWDFYRNALTQPDQLRQRVAWALSQMVVVSNVEVESTYGLRNYQNMLLMNAFGNYREVLKKVALSPVMGSYLGNVNNDKTAPNENFARELLQLFAIGPCHLNNDATLASGTCLPTYDDQQVRAYAYALTGWIYPPGGSSPSGCWPQGTHCRFHNGDMVAQPARHDTQARTLLTGLYLPAGHTAPQALDAVIESLMRHPSMAPFVSRQLIQHLVTSNPSPAYVNRVVSAFNSGSHAGFGTGVRGDLKATVAAVLLDTEAREEPTSPTAGRLREPVQMFLGVIRALNGQTDGDSLGWWWGDMLGQHAFRAPSVFNYYSPSYPLPQTNLVGPTFALHGASTALARINFVHHAVNWGAPVNTNIPNAVGTKVDLANFLPDANDPPKLVDRLSLLALGELLPPTNRAQVIDAVNAFTPQTGGVDYLRSRVRSAAYLVFSTPQYHVVR
ncbi:MAG: DUF1800 family protein [Pseudomonadota bacterium]